MIPDEKVLVERLKNEPFALVGINTDRDKDLYRARAKEMGVTWRSSWQGGQDGPIPKAWGIRSYPTIYVIDDQGTLRFSGLRGPALSNAVDQLLAEMKARKPVK